MKEDGAACWERGQPAAGQEEGDVLQGFAEQIQLTAPELCIIPQQQKAGEDDFKLAEQFCQKHYADQYDRLFQHSAFTQMVLYLPDIILSELFLFRGLEMKDLAMIIYTKHKFILPAEKCSSLHNLHILLSKDLFFIQILAGEFPCS